MDSKRVLATWLAILMVTFNFTAEAALKYQQSVTFTSWKSQEDVEQKVQEFREAATGDPDIQIAKVQYRKKKLGKDDFAYEAIVTCQMAEKDKVMEVQGKAFQQRHKIQQLTQTKGSE